MCLIYRLPRRRVSTRTLWASKPSPTPWLTITFEWCGARRNTRHGSCVPAVTSRRGGRVGARGSPNSFRPGAGRSLHCRRWVCSWSVGRGYQRHGCPREELVPITDVHELHGHHAVVSRVTQDLSRGASRSCSHLRQ